MSPTRARTSNHHVSAAGDHRGARSAWVTWLLTWISWVLASGLGGALAMLLSALWGPAAVASGAILGTSQWFALRRHASVTPWWILVTAVSLPLAGNLFFTRGLWDLATHVREAFPLLRRLGSADVVELLVLGPVMAGAATGVSLGCRQPLSVPAAAWRRALWASASAVAGAAVLPVGTSALYAAGVYFEHTTGRGYSVSSQIAAVVIAGLLGAAHALLTGSALAALLGQPRRSP